MEQDEGRTLEIDLKKILESFLWTGHCSCCIQHVSFPIASGYYVQGLLSWINKSFLHYEYN